MQGRFNIFYLLYKPIKGGKSQVIISINEKNHNQIQNSLMILKKS